MKALVQLHVWWLTLHNDMRRWQRAVKCVKRPMAKFRLLQTTPGFGNTALGSEYVLIITARFMEKNFLVIVDTTLMVSRCKVDTFLIEDHAV